ncbi:MAG: glycosyltransferase family 9 protein, partial [Planctomycetes bacterium]|nr:glycosyltransferase family 9 protein [Planctomycetota bacterium]
MKQLPRADIQRILIRGANWVGDAIMSTPTICAIRTNFPQAHISLLVKPWVAPLFEHNPHIDHIFLYRAEGRHRGWRGKLRLGADLRRARFDLAILLQNAFEAAYLAWIARIPHRLGYNTDARS